MRLGRGAGSDSETFPGWCVSAKVVGVVVWMRGVHHVSMRMSLKASKYVPVVEKTLRLAGGAAQEQD